MSLFHITAVHPDDISLDLSLFVVEETWGNALSTWFRWLKDESEFVSSDAIFEGIYDGLDVDAGPFNVQVFLIPTGPYFTKTGALGWHTDIQCVGRAQLRDP